MKASRFNAFFTYTDGTILGYNSKTRGLIELDKLEYEAYHKLSTGENPSFIEQKQAETFIKELARGKFLIPDDIDELTQAKAAYHVSRFMSRSPALTVVVTHRCNLACPYCYEERQPYSLAQKHIPLILKAAEGLIQQAHAESLHVSWYGGEPLLKPDFIFGLSQKLETLCEKEKVKYSSSIITNGTLLTRQIAKMLRKHKVGSAQITLDGPREVHDKRRIYPNGKGSFTKIIENIKQSHDLIEIKIRVNVDTNNVNTASDVLDVLESEGLKANLYNVGFAPVSVDTEKCIRFEHECYTKQDFSQIEVALLEKTIRRGFPIDKSACLPQAAPISCGAVSPHSMVIDAKGLIQKCWNPLGDRDEAIAFLTGFRTIRGKKGIRLSDVLPEKDNTSKWLAFDPFSFEKCRDCNLLPTCLGGCPWKVIGLKREPECPTWRHNIKERMWLYRECLNVEKKDK